MEIFKQKIILNSCSKPHCLDLKGITISIVIQLFYFLVSR